MERPLHVTELVLGQTEQVAQLDVELAQTVGGLVVQDRDVDSVSAGGAAEEHLRRSGASDELLRKC